MKEMRLRNRLATMVDDDDFEFLNQWKWSSSKIGRKIYVVRWHGGGHYRRNIIQALRCKERSFCSCRLYSLSFEGIKQFLSEIDIEGIVFHHPDGRMCKIRKSDFGIKRAIQKQLTD